MPSLLLVRSGFESDLVDECLSHSIVARRVTDGAIAADAALPGPPFIFERQRLPHAVFVEEALTRPVSEALFESITAVLRASPQPWSLQVMATDTALLDRVNGFARALERLIQRHLPDLARRRIPHAVAPDDLVLQLCRVPDGVWYSTARAEQLSSPWPGGVPRLKDDPGAPSRSFLKLEEAFLMMGVSPVAGETAVDLGAAPGGWTLALAKRGCNVCAVDNGPLRLPPYQPGWGRVDYRRANGITFQPSKPVDWLVADMLVAPGVIAGLLRRWIRGRCFRRMVVNVKIPQQEAFRAIQPLAADLQATSRGRLVIRQLYHDRREVTVMGALAD